MMIFNRIAARVGGWGGQLRGKFLHPYVLAVPLGAS